LDTALKARSFTRREEKALFPSAKTRNEHSAAEPQSNSRTDAGKNHDLQNHGFVPHDFAQEPFASAAPGSSATFEPSCGHQAGWQVVDVAAADSLEA
jgi:hypothetical protein